jgi:hypothetical protein
MRLLTLLISICISFSIFFSCSVSGYITDPQSIERQKKMHSYRTGVNIGEGSLLVASSVVAMFTGVNIYPDAQSQSFKLMRLINESKDTLFVNMVTDWQWRDSTFCDIREIVMPPLKSAKVIVPMGVNYNVFYRNDYNAPDDEKVEINTSQTRRLKLKTEKIKPVTIQTNIN